MSDSASLKRRALKSGGWVVAGYVINQVIKLGSSLILTRLLFPKAFGLMAIVSVVLGALKLFSDIGIDVSITQNHRGDDAEFLNTAWVVKILRGCLLCVIVLVVAKILPVAASMGWFPTGSVYANPMLPSILNVMAITVLVDGFISTKMGLAQRKLKLERIIKIQLLSKITAFPVTVAWAWWYHSIWALVGGAVVAKVVQCLLSHVWLPGAANKFQWNKLYFSEIFHFGKYVFLLSIIGFLVINGDRLVLGGLLSASQLGVYSIAFILSSTALSMYRTLLSKLVFPALSEVSRHRPDDTPRIYMKLQAMTDFGLFCAAGFIYVAGETIVSILYDPRYHDAGGMLSILSLCLIGIRYNVVEQLMLAAGHMRYLMTWSLIRTFTLFTGILLGFRIYGMHGALYAIVFSYFSPWPVAFYYKHRHKLANWKWELLAWPVFGIGAGAGLLFRQSATWVAHLIGH